jgi:hypothetical protein
LLKIKPDGISLLYNPIDPHKLFKIFAIAYESYSSDNLSMFGFIAIIKKHVDLLFNASFKLFFNTAIG